MFRTGGLRHLPVTISSGPHSLSASLASLPPEPFSVQDELPHTQNLPSGQPPV